MNVYTKFLTYTFSKSLIFVLTITLSLVFILNLLTELDFFKDISIEIYFPLFLSILNSPSMIFEIFPFIILVTTQLFFIKLFNNNEIETKKNFNNYILITTNFILEKGCSDINN